MTLSFSAPLTGCCPWVTVGLVSSLLHATRATRWTLFNSVTAISEALNRPRRGTCQTCRVPVMGQMACSSAHTPSSGWEGSRLEPQLTQEGYEREMKYRMEQTPPQPMRKVCSPRHRLKT